MTKRMVTCSECKREFNTETEAYHYTGGHWTNNGQEYVEAQWVCAKCDPIYPAQQD